MTITKEQWEELSSCVSLTREAILLAVSSPQWQQYRILLLGRSMKAKFNALKWWISDKNKVDITLEMRQIQVANYVNALKRGGLIK